MHGGIRTQQQSAARQAEQSCPRNGIGIAGWIVALASAVVLAVSFWVGQKDALAVLRLTALLLAAAGTALCGVGAARAGGRRLNGFAFCGLLIGAAVLCTSAPLLVAMLG